MNVKVYKATRVHAPGRRNSHGNVVGFLCNTHLDPFTLLHTTDRPVDCIRCLSALERAR